MIKNLLWCLFVPVNVKVFYRAGQLEIRSYAGFTIAQKAFDLCTKREQEFIIWRDPVFKEFLDAKS